jgi:hypothetical protein
MVDRRATSVFAVRAFAVPLFVVSVALVLAGSGCSPTTRLPSIYPSPGDSDARSFNVHDPLPETDIGPDMGARPPGFMQDWSEPRRTRAAQSMLGVQPGGGGNGPGAPIVPGGPVPGGPMPGPGGPMVPPQGQPIGPGPTSQMYPDAVPQ